MSGSDDVLATVSKSTTEIFTYLDDESHLTRRTNISEAVPHELKDHSANAIGFATGGTPRLSDIDTFGVGCRKTSATWSTPPSW